MSSPATCMGVAARCGPLVLGVEPVEGQWRITITDAERNVILHRARTLTLKDAKHSAQDLALMYQAARNGSASITEEEFMWVPVTA